jgi:peptidoglycan lytic transglycosylase D
MTFMRRLWLIAVVVLSAVPALAQEDRYTLDDVLQSAQQWANENLDPGLLQALKGVDQQRVRQSLNDFRKTFQGQYVLDLAGLRDTATKVLPLLDRYQETAPYAAWLRTRLDYLDVANELRLIVTPPTQSKRGKPPQPTPNPPPELERKVWIEALARRPLPKAARPYLARLKAIFKEEGVPPDLAWIAEVESSFDPVAESPAGAAGMFQLMPATARRYGLRMRPSDQRLNPEESARAAAKYLQFLHRHFGSWRLAVAAYNAGEGTVQRLLDRTRSRSYDAIAEHLPAETQMYVPKVEATLLRREGLKFSQLEIPKASRG